MKNNIEFIESTLSGFDKIDKENRLIRGVSVLGKFSSNKYISGSIGTEFSQSAMQDISTLGEGCPIYLDHPGIQADKENRGVRSVRDLAGVLEATRIDGDRVRGDIRYNRKHQELVEDMVENLSHKIGMSVHAFGPMSYNHTTKMGICESIKRLPSVDIVSSPANVGGMFESQQNTIENEDSEMKTELEYSEAFAVDGDDYRKRKADIEKEHGKEITEAAAALTDEEKEQEKYQAVLDADYEGL